MRASSTSFEVSKRTDISICSITNFLEKLMSIVGMDPSDTVNLHEEDFFRLHPEKNYHKNNLYRMLFSDNPLAKR